MTLQEFLVAGDGFIKITICLMLLIGASAWALIEIIKAWRNK